MKKLSVSLLALFLLAASVPSVQAAVSPAGSYEIDVSLGFARGPGDFDDDWGISLGAGYMISNIENLQARIDISYFAFDKDFLNLELRRLPVAAGGRYYFLAADRLNLFAEGAVEASYDIEEYTLLGKHKDRKINVGVTPGAGAEYFPGDAVSVFIFARYHVISEDYFSLHFGGAYHF